MSPVVSAYLGQRTQAWSSVNAPKTTPRAQGRWGTSCQCFVNPKPEVCCQRPSSQSKSQQLSLTKHRIRGKPVPINHCTARYFTQTSPPAMRQVHFMKLETGSEREGTGWSPCLASSTARALNHHTELTYWLADSKQSLHSEIWKLPSCYQQKVSNLRDNPFSFQSFLSSSLQPLRRPQQQGKQQQGTGATRVYTLHQHFSSGKYLPKKGPWQRESSLLRDVCSRLIHASLELEKIQMS